MQTAYGDQGVSKKPGRVGKRKLTIQVHHPTSTSQSKSARIEVYAVNDVGNDEQCMCNGAGE